MNLHILAAVFVVTAFAGGKTPEQRGRDIAFAVEKANSGFGGELSEIKMVLYNAHGDKTVRRMSIKTKETPKDGDKSIISFIWPADVKGTRMLTWTHKRDDDDQWLYMPALKRTKRISARNQSGSFMGSEFAYEDMGSQEPEKYHYKHLKNIMVKKRKFWLLERIPKGRSGYGRELLWIDRKYMNPTKTEFYDSKNELLKTATFKRYARYGRYWRPRSIEMFNHQTRKHSILYWEKRDLGERFNDEDFDRENLDY